MPKARGGTIGCVLECQGTGSTSYGVGSVHDFECLFRSEER
jgi:hypothetical protein